MSLTFIKRGLIAAGLMNIVGVLFFSRLFTNTVINDADPVVMSNFGLVMIVIWGLVFIACATITNEMKWLSSVFIIEKLIYVIMWLIWLNNNSLGLLYDKDLFAGIFYSIYGLNDFVFMIFLSWYF